MPTLLPWTSVEIGDVDAFLPSLPSLVVYTWYVDDEPESTVTYFWRDPDTGLVHHELVLLAPVGFDEAVTRAREEAPKRSVERIHVKHARTPRTTERKARTRGAARATAAQSKKRAPAKPRAAKRRPRKS